jgi:hypothetical protein
MPWVDANFFVHMCLRVPQGLKGLESSRPLYGTWSSGIQASKTVPGSTRSTRF